MTTQLNLDIVWASTGGLTVRPDWTQGWFSEIPSFQQFNYLLNAMDRNSLSLAESGDWQWEAAIAYEVGATVLESGVQYHCITQHTNELPSTDTLLNYWVKAPTYGTGTPQKNLGLSVREVNVRAAGNVWSGHDVTIENSSALTQYATLTGSDNWLMGNVGGNLVAIKTGATQVPDDRSIAIGAPNVFKLFHEGNLPTVAQIVGAVEEAPEDGKLYARVDGGWTVVTSTSVSETVPQAAVGAGAGWYNLTDGQFYIDIFDGDTSQWVLASPPIIPNYSAVDVEYDDTVSGLGDNVQAALDTLGLKGRNKLVNGNFDIWQRGATLTLVGSAGSYLADRWLCGQATGTTDINRIAFIPGQTDVPSEPKYFLRIDKLSAEVTASVPIEQRIEGVRTLAGQLATLSFWAKSDAPKTFKAVVNQDFGVGGSPAVSGFSDDAINVTTSWQKFTVTGTMPSIAGKTVGTDDYVLFALLESTGFSEYTLDIAQVQIEEGGSATKFEQRHIAEELALCQRYYWTIPEQADFYLSMYNNDTDKRRVSIMCPVTMRSDPSVVMQLNTGTPVVSEISAGSIQLLATGVLAASGVRLTTLEVDAEL